jgi:predicted DCC family thiol-disulfide oxidoreductase YuxK
MKTLTILYDENCRLCCRIKAWLLNQSKYVDLDFIAAGSGGAPVRRQGVDTAI